MKKKILLASIIALSLALLVAVGGTIAYLFVETGNVTNTFTYGDINIVLKEFNTEAGVNNTIIFGGENDSGSDPDRFKMIPGNTYAKDPNVTVKDDSEACYLFIKVTTTNNPETYLDYSIDSNYWTPLSGVEGVYYYNGTDLDQQLTEDKTYPILTNNRVSVNVSVTKEQLTAIGTDYPTMTFHAYAVQKANVADVATAWRIAQAQGGVPTT